ncbi:MAG: hypothetical protein ONA90_08070, partial [candidate division KSB1 bacterium]|nr:hypothetical protein [candidate division KSB1 bacterium]
MLYNYYQSMKPLPRRKVLAFGAVVVLVAGLVVVAVVAARQVFAFNPPSNAAGVGGGALSADSSNNIGVGVAPASNSRFTIQGTTADFSTYGLIIKSATGSNIFTVRNDTRVVIGAAASSTMLSVGGDIWTSGTVYAGAVTGALSGTLNAANVSAGTFASNTGGGNFSFPAGLTVDTNTLYVDAVNDRVGIGTTSPGAKLHTNVSSGDNYIYLTNAGNTTSDRAQIWFGVNYPSATDWAGIGIFGNDGKLRLTGGGSLSSPGLTIDNSNNVGIGTTGPTQLLDVKGNAQFYDNTSGIGKTLVLIRGGEGQGASDNLTEWRNKDNSLMSYMRFNGNLVIGENIDISHPSAGLRMQNGGSVIFGSRTQIFSNATGMVDIVKGSEAQTLRIYNLTDSDVSPTNYERAKLGWASNVFILGTEAGGTGVVRNIALTGGNVGIGTTNPGYKLDVQGTGSLTQPVV